MIIEINNVPIIHAHIATIEFLKNSFFFWNLKVNECADKSVINIERKKIVNKYIFPFFCNNKKYITELNNQTKNSKNKTTVINIISIFFMVVIHLARFINITLIRFVMAISSSQKLKLKKFINELASFRARHTELVSVYIPAGYDINKISNHLSQEKGTAENIKSSQTRNNVKDALERMIQHLKLYKVTPPHGLAIFSGNVAEKLGDSDVQVWSLEPPIPLKMRLYRCDKVFVVDILEKMLETDEIYGLVVMDRREGNLALLKGKVIVPLITTTSNVPGKTKAGGQSAQRFARLREGAAKDFYKKIAQYMKEQFYGLKNLKGILIGGPGHTKNEFIEMGYILQPLKEKIIAIKDLSYTGPFGLEELLDKSQDVLANQAIADEKGAMQKFLTRLAKNPNAVCYGFEDSLEKIRMGAVETLLISESLEDEKIDLLDSEAQNVGTEIKLISVDTREGFQLKEMGKVAGILRFGI